MQPTRSRTLPVLGVAVFVLAIAGLVFILAAPGSKSTRTAGGKAGPVKAAPATPAFNGRVDVRLDEFSIKPSISDVPAGKVTFVATNAGKAPHEMVVIRTDKPADALAKGGRASEAGAVDEIGDFAAGRTKRLTLNLKPGHYALICNLPGHYKAGMAADFVVK